jgi:CRP/FNR family transcriptional regulator, nitrogen fixation regulation protein
MFATVASIAARSRSMPPQAVTDAVPVNVLEPLRGLAVTMRMDRDEEIVAQGDQAGYCYLLTGGCARTVKLMEDGRRQVGEFLLAGDLFGWEAIEAHDFGVEAVTPLTLLRYPRSAIEALADRDRDFARKLRALTASQIRAGRERLVLLGRKTAGERIASFLIEMAGRIRGSGTMIGLPMNRADMADYLGLTIETVCRGLTQLRTRGVIAVERSKIVILDRHALGVAGCETVH